MTYPIPIKKKRLTRPTLISKKSGALGVTPTKTQAAFYVPTWGLFGSDPDPTDFSQYQPLVNSDYLEDGEHIYDTLWIGKNIVPEIKYINGTWRDYPVVSVSIFKSLAFEDGRTDSFLDTFFSSTPETLGQGSHLIAITKSFKLPNEAATMTNAQALATQVVLGAVDEATGQPITTPNHYSWNVYLPGIFETIPFGIYKNLWGQYNEADGIDQQVHIYLDRHTSVPTILRPTLPSLDPDAPAVIDGAFDNSNIYFHVNADLYDEFVATYEGWFRGIIKIEDTVSSWVEDNDLENFKKEYFEPSYTYSSRTVPDFKPETIDFALIDPTKSEIPDMNTKIVYGYLTKEPDEIEGSSGGDSGGGGTK